MKRYGSLALVALVGLAVLYVIFTRVFVSEETRIRRVIGVMETAVERGNMLRLADHVASDYSDDWGMDKASVIMAIRAARQQYSAVFIHLTDVTVKLDETDRTRAAVTLIARVLANPKSGDGSTELFTDRFRLFFRKGDDGWKLYRVESPELRFD